MINIYSVYDKVAKNYGQPFYVKNDDIAKRDFANFVSQPGSIVNSNSEDFSLVRVGSWDSEKGLLMPELEPVHISYANEFKKGVN